MDEKVSGDLFDGAVAEEKTKEVEPETGEQQAPPPGEQVRPEITLESLQSEMSELKRANAGLIHALTDERGKRQQHEGKLQGISETFAKALEARKEQEAPAPEEPEVQEKIPVDFDEDGTPFMKTSDILNLTQSKKEEPKIEALDKKIDEVSTQMVQNQALQQQQKAISAIINSNPAYPRAMNELQSQWQALNGMYDQYIQTNGLPVPNSIEEAMGQILSSPVSQEFQRYFPNSDVELLVETFTTPNNAVMKRKLTKALWKASKSNGVGQPKPNLAAQENLDKLANKPTGFGQVSNQAKSSNTTIETVADMSFDDFMSLSDKDIDKVHSLLAAEEK